jgi:acyl-CoA synthetase (AMP-forming)/AMP-acid ligase II
MAAFRPLTCNFLGRQLAPKPLSLLTSSLSSGSTDDHQRRRLQHTSAVEEQHQQQQPQSQVIRDMMAPRIVRCPFPDIELPCIPYAEFVLQGSESLSSETAVQCGMTGRSYSYGVLNMAVRRLGAALSKRGFVKGDVLALISPNIPEFAVAFLAATSVGGVVTTVNPIYTTEEIARQLVDCNAKFVLTVPFCSETVVNAAAKSPSVQEVFSVGDAPGCTPAMAMLADADEKYFPHNLKIDPYDDLVCLPYSSGTTGPPKGVMITHFNLCANITQMCHPEFVGNIGGDDIMLAVLPFFHIYGLSGVMSVGLHTKSKIVTLPKFDPEMYINALREHRVRMNLRIVLIGMVN